jgi:hypothetical protein
MAKATPQIYQIKITLTDSKPPIWRRILVASETKLFQLHQIIQAVMPWGDEHLHMFEVGEIRYSVPYEPGALAELDMEDERRVKLSQIVTGEKFKFVYQYDFGDSWYHRLVVEKILPFDETKKLPICIKGERACPPDDSGGIWNYPNFLEALEDPDHPDHELYREWMGDEPFDPEAFDLDAINQRLQGLA